MKKLTANKLGAALLIGYAVYALLKDVFRHYVISTCSRVTIATPIDISSGYRRTRSIIYTYSLNGKKHEGMVAITKLKDSKGDDYFYMKKRYFVKVACKFPSFSPVDDEFNVPDTIVSVPYKGWNNIPVKK
ncbi:hypothetical protein [Spirosoma oryzae]|uniref:hypothetical protein n=1 Tax=Spirosoma oryzae TaxID=1469603 RepID=UPI0011B1F095|nr:hypothetical protein [Spirosoma oryzae]